MLLVYVCPYFISVLHKAVMHGDPHLFTYCMSPDSSRQLKSRDSQVSFFLIETPRVELGVTDEGNIQNVQSSGSIGPGLKTTEFITLIFR